MAGRPCECNATYCALGAVSNGNKRRRVQPIAVRPQTRSPPFADADGPTEITTTAAQVPPTHGSPPSQRIDTPTHTERLSTLQAPHPRWPHGTPAPGSHIPLATPAIAQNTTAPTASLFTPPAGTPREGTAALHTTAQPTAPDLLILLQSNARTSTAHAVNLKEKSSTHATTTPLSSTVEAIRSARTTSSIPRGTPTQLHRGSTIAHAGSGESVQDVPCAVMRQASPNVGPVPRAKRIVEVACVVTPGLQYAAARPTAQKQLRNSRAATEESPTGAGTATLIGLKQGTSHANAQSTDKPSIAAAQVAAVVQPTAATGVSLQGPANGLTSSGATVVPSSAASAKASDASDASLTAGAPTQDPLCSATTILPTAADASRVATTTTPLAATAPTSDARQRRRSFAHITAMKKMPPRAAGSSPGEYRKSSSPETTGIASPHAALGTTRDAIGSIGARHVVHPTVPGPSTAPRASRCAEASAETVTTSAHKGGPEATSSVQQRPTSIPSGRESSGQQCTAVQADPNRETREARQEINPVGSGPNGGGTTLGLTQSGTSDVPEDAAGYELLDLASSDEESSHSNLSRSHVVPSTVHPSTTHGTTAVTTTTFRHVASVSTALSTGNSVTQAMVNDHASKLTSPRNGKTVVAVPAKTCIVLPTGSSMEATTSTVPLAHNQSSDMVGGVPTPQTTTTACVNKRSGSDQDQRIEQLLAAVYGDSTHTSSSDDET